MEDTPKPLISEQEEERIRRQFLELEDALVKYIKDIENRLPTEKFCKIVLPMIKDLQETRYVDHHKIYAEDLCKYLNKISSALKDFSNEVSRAVIELKDVCSCGL